jgi:hypothetical protein
MTTDQQVRRLMLLIKKGLPLSTAAMKAGMSEPTARKYRRAGKLPSELKASHAWRTCPGPFAEVWPEIEALLEGVRSAGGRGVTRHRCAVLPEMGVDAHHELGIGEHREAGLDSSWASRVCPCGLHLTPTTVGRWTWPSCATRNSTARRRRQRVGEARDGERP